MIENLSLTIRNLSAGILLTLMAGVPLQAQGTGLPQNCSDPGSNVGDTGCVRFVYQGQQVTYATVRAKDGNIWLQQNLGSSQVATGMDDENSYGDFFQWGRWDDGHQLKNSPLASVPQVNNPDGLAGIHSFIIGSSGWWDTNALSDTWAGKNVTEVTDAVGIDPCKAIGADWKMPSQPEWKTITSAENITSPGKAHASNLKLPAGGYRSNLDGDFTFVGKRGYYWSSDPTGIGGKYLYVGATVANASAGAPRGQGASVRCIKPAASLGTAEVRLNSPAIGIYPNPVKDIITIKTDVHVEAVNIFNAVGQKMKTEFSNNRVDVSGFPSGVYMLELTFKNGQSISKKIIKD